MSDLQTNEYDTVAKEILDTGWFEDTKSDYSSMFFKHVTYDKELHVLDIGSHLGLWCLRILEHSKNNDINTKIVCVDPCIDSTDAFESNTKEYESSIEHFELAVVNEPSSTKYIRSLEENSLGSLQISHTKSVSEPISVDVQEDGEDEFDADGNQIEQNYKINEFGYPNEIVFSSIRGCDAQTLLETHSKNISASSLNAVVCYACGYEYEILKSLEFLFDSSQSITYVFQLYDKTLKQCGSSLSEVLDYMKSKGFENEKTDLHYATSHKNDHLDHTYYTFYK